MHNVQERSDNLELMEGKLYLGGWLLAHGMAT
jgi:hypothetical protein